MTDSIGLMEAINVRFTKVFFVIVAAFLGAFLCASAQAQSDYTYTTNNGTISITGYTGSGGEVSIPATILDLPVTKISGFAFYRISGVTKVTIPNSVVSLEAYAFEGCSDLANVVISDGATTIEVGAFYGCTSLRSIVIPDSVITIGVSAFSDCYGLTNITIGNGVTTIGDKAFNACTHLRNITIGEYVATIGVSAFSYCYGLTNISVNTLNSNFGCLDGVLFNKSKTTLIRYPIGIDKSDYTIPNGVTCIGTNAFADSCRLTTIIIPNSVTCIGDLAFINSCSLESISIPGSVTTIGVAAFCYCSGLTNITIPDSVTSIGSEGFYNCANLTSVSLGNSITNIESFVFYACRSLTNIVIPSSVKDFGESAFSLCSGLTSVTIGNGCTRIGYYTFSDCTNLFSVYFKGNAPSVIWSPFENNNEVTVFYLPGALGWGTTFAGRPTAQWVLPNPQMLNAGSGFGVQSNGFGFTISWATNVPVVVDACTNLANPIWSPIQTNTLTDGSVYFSDPEWSNYPTRIYRLRTP